MRNLIKFNQVRSTASKLKLLSHIKVDWRAAKNSVRLIQQAIAVAYLAGNMREVKRLQYLLVSRYEARALAVKTVITNPGGQTPGVDGVVWNTPQQTANAVDDLRRQNGKAYKAKPVKRVMIPKASGGLRPLGIPTMQDRAMQALWAMALTPIAESTADSNSYGFRENRGTADAATHIQKVLGGKYTKLRWILDADIKGYFDNICHEWIQKNIPMDRDVLREFLKAGFVIKGEFEPTDLGVPQGGVISPVISNMVLDGLQKYITDKVHPRGVLIRYADDFIVCLPTKEDAEQAKPLIADFLKVRGVELNEAKTQIRSVVEGFDFVGFTFKEYPDSRYAFGLKQGAFLVKPQAKKVTGFKEKIQSLIHEYRDRPLWMLIEKLSQVLQGWANSYRISSCRDAFSDVSNTIFYTIWRMLRSKHPRLSVTELRRRFFTRVGNNVWVLFAKKPDCKPIYLFQIASVRKMYHILIKPLNPYLPENTDYFTERKTSGTRRHVK